MLINPLTAIAWVKGAIDIVEQAGPILDAFGIGNDKITQGANLAGAAQEIIGHVRTAVEEGKLAFSTEDKMALAEQENRLWALAEEWNRKVLAS